MESECQRYARHLSLPEFGEAGQRRLRESSVLCLGVGGLGSPAAMYLAAAGVGRLGIVDADRVELSNLQRQLLHGTPDIGRSKTDSARERLRAINPEVEVVAHDVRFTARNAMELAADFDVIVDGTDNFPTRYLSNDVAVLQRKPNVYGSIFRFEGQCAVFAPHLGGPCYRCLFPQPPDPGQIPNCAEGGVLGVLPGIVGTLQALEAIKLIAGVGDPLVGRLLHCDALGPRFREFTLRRDPECPLCGEHPTITELVDYYQFCGLPDPHDLPTATVAELAEMRGRGDGFTLLDVREPDEFAAARIDGSRLIPLGELPDRLDELDRDAEILVHCKSGGRSARAVALLLDAGFSRARNVEGGIDAWHDRADNR